MFWSMVLGPWCWGSLCFGPLCFGPWYWVHGVGDYDVLIHGVGDHCVLSHGIGTIVLGIMMF